MNQNKKRIFNDRKYIFENDVIDISHNYNKDIDLKSIAEWISCGFFLGDKNFTKQKYGKNNGYTFKSNWYYEPKNISFDEAVMEFTEIFENIININTYGKNLILPLSGGLDSRTLATALRKKKNIKTYSYEFENGISEIKYAKQISLAMDWDFSEFIIPKGYLWPKIEKLARINFCQVDFIHPRQFAVIDKICKLGDCIVSGQWGDVLFDIPKINDNASINEQTKYLFSKIVKPGGLELSEKLWDEWGYPGRFENILYEKIQNLLLEIKIENPSRRILAFKSLHWAQRWANPNLKIFSERLKLVTPYYDDKICEFICKVPNEYLQDRKIQIKYIKDKTPKLAKISWQAYDLDLYKFKYFNSLYFFRRVRRFLLRKIQNFFSNSPLTVQRNWEIQFYGIDNSTQLENWLFKKKYLKDLVYENLIREFYHKFKSINPVFYSHPISMLLTLSVWCEKFWKKK